MSIQVYIEKCPNCKHIIRRETGQGCNIEKEWGSPIEICSFCNSPYLTGRKHAGTMSVVEFRKEMFWRVLFTLIRTCMAFSIGLMMIIILTPLKNNFGDDDPEIVVIPLIGGVVLGLIYSFAIIPKRIRNYRDWRPSMALQALWNAYQKK